jgi:hypothetical protein
LKIVVDTEQFSVERVAIEVEAMAVDPKVFELPAGMATEKSPY